MGLITTIEEKLGNLVEKPFQEKNAMDPLLLEIAVKRQLLKQRKDVLGIIMVPHNLEIIMDQKLYEDFEPFFTDLERGLRKTLKEWLKDNDFEMADPLQIGFRKGGLETEKMSVLAVFSPFPSDYRSGDYLNDVRIVGFYKDKEEEMSKEIPKEKEVSDNKVPEEKIQGELCMSNTGQQFKIYKEDTIIGRDSDCDILINDPTVSRIHAAITRQYGKFILEDLGSKSGTRVNRVRIDKTSLINGDCILIGETELIFQNQKGE